ncbi:hypothetical protein LOK49_LG11G00762 [Camellia lanceoleosa]|uniref:Uncharacterized protein n=1 Tax=Camellia lanceoleosa TaxID=1840588 RepID=A0ACC0G1Q8_9ERIC|nr:hypothetical protein LOK49_LG11G00762 [Camellia lanceoleosa]
MRERNGGVRKVRALCLGFKENEAAACLGLESALPYFAAGIALGAGSGLSAVLLDFSGAAAGLMLARGLLLVFMGCIWGSLLTLRYVWCFGAAN